MNVLFLLTPKKNVLFLTHDMSVKTALELLKNVRYSSVPLLDEHGYYLGTITEGDLLWYLEAAAVHAEAMEKPISDIKRLRDYKVSHIDVDIDELFVVAINQNYIPIVDDRGFFIGIITRKEIITYYNTLLKEYKGMKYNSHNPALDTMLRRRSIRQFKDSEIEETIIDDIIKAGLVAPSAKNRRPIHIFYAHDEKLFKKLGECSPSFNILSRSPYAFFVFGDTVHEDDEFLLNNNASAVTMNLLNAITSFNLGAVWLGAAKSEANNQHVQEVLKIEPRYRLYSIIAFGVPDETKEGYQTFDLDRVHKHKW